LSRIVTRAVKVSLAFTAALGVLAFTSVGVGDILLDVYLLAMGGVLLLALVRTTRVKAPASGPSGLDQALKRMETMPADSEELTLARDLELSRASAFHLHVRLRPVFQEIASHRLRKRYGVELASEPERARELLGTASWEIVRPDRLPPADRLAKGSPLSELREVVDELERV
jgi:hypothetical protein